MQLSVFGIATDEFDRIRAGGGDANGEAPVVRVAEGPANPCRHCLQLIAPGEEKLVLSHRPFAAPQPYAETGPIFLHARECTRYESDALPAWFAFLDPAAIRGYGADGWIRYETGQIVRGAELADTCRTILSDEEIAFVHIRSKFGCFQCQVERA
ncbi:MAG: DUF1203 domain-containing protein [Hyphomonadaceae bacterium]